MTKALIGIRGSLRSLSFRQREQEYKKKDIVACIFSVGERSEPLAIESVRDQDLPVKRIEVIRDVTPMHAAFNRMFDVAHDADYILCVDADMVLHKNCTYELLRLACPDTLYCIAPLMDPVLGMVGYIKLLNMSLVRRLGIRFRDVMGCDMDFIRQAKDLDPSIQAETYVVPRKPMGIHHPTYTAQELFKKNQIEKKKRGNKVKPDLLLSMIQKYHETGNLVLLAGILGDLLPNPDTSPGESTPVAGLDLWPEVEKLVGPIPDDLEFGFDKE